MFNFLFLKKTRRLVQAGLFAASLLTGSAYAIDLWEFSAQDVLPILTEFKTAAKLSANQQTLWQQMESKTKTIFRSREDRRHEIQSNIKNRLKDKSPELRDLAISMNQEDKLSAQENQELREYWMTMYDALNDGQRDMLAALISDQLARVADKPKEIRTNGEKPSGAGRHGNKGGMGNQNRGSEL
ncbi:MAG: hypothetical protein V4447_15725 [Pseudomonadota bacterium]